MINRIKKIYSDILELGTGFIIVLMVELFDPFEPEEDYGLDYDETYNPRGSRAW